MGKPKARNRKSAALNKENEKKAHRTPKPADYTVSDILDRAESCLDECELQLAQKFCQRALEMDNDNLRALQLREGAGDTSGALVAYPVVPGTKIHFSLWSGIRPSDILADMLRIRIFIFFIQAYITSTTRHENVDVCFSVLNPVTFPFLKFS
jgi:hypothetical protein